METARNLTNSTRCPGSEDPLLRLAHASGSAMAELPRLGAEVLENGGVGYCVWAPTAGRVTVWIEGAAGDPRAPLALARGEGGYFHGTDPAGRAGDRYRIQLDDGDHLPDPASRCQPAGVHEHSMVVDPAGFAWTDATWRRPRLAGLVIYELHVGTFSPEGTFAGVRERLPELRALGVTALEIMPVAEFGGTRNWGYDGALLFAPEHAYGTPDDFRALVDAAHAHGLAVILDVVYNHFGASGNRLRQFAPHFFDSGRVTPWGESIHFDGPNAPQVRAFFRQNLIAWMEEYHLDGFRLDATHAIFDESQPHILRELRDAAQARGCFVIAEDERIDPALLEADGCQLDGVWEDAFHHSLSVTLLGKKSYYSRRFRGGAGELAAVLRADAWRAVAQDPFRPHQFVFCISNHDQAGNRPWGERLHQLCSAAEYRAASALLCLAPQTPLLFMGQEWAASSPFTYFTDHEEWLQNAVTRGRKREFLEKAVYRAEVERRGMPLPEAESTFRMSKLVWEERAAEPHAGVLRLYREALRLRATTPFARLGSFGSFEAVALGEEVLAVRADSDAAGSWLLLCVLRPPGRGRGDEERPIVLDPPAGTGWHLEWSSEAVRFGGSRADGRSFAVAEIAECRNAEVLLLRADRPG